MKHTVWQTVYLLLLTAIAGMAGILLADVDFSAQELAQTAPPLLVIGMVLVGLVVGSLLFAFLMKRKNSDALVSLLICIAAYTGTVLFRPLHWLEIAGVNIGCMIIYVVLFAMLWISHVLMRRSWKYRWAIHLWNIGMLLGFLYIGIEVAQIGHIIAIGVLLVILAVYDHIAVNKTGWMGKMATFMIDARAIPGIGIAKKEEGKFGILGGGDIFMIVATAAAVQIAFGFVAAFTILGGMMLSMVYIFLMSKPGKFYPAVPFILLGAIVGATVVVAAHFGAIAIAMLL